ncbi:hypothetical protein BpHYR1_038326 [Brachionus plicatilis]|uniref:Uncharacterized protein n=1 Tax=Brachionus plicatilis TaxID=10195 RepID=A0A3M7SH66_BRAPC|nr:hypothetical protein BpHYR1_038326 [Brachionus plicatilis]
MLHATRFECLLNAFFAANLAAPDDSTETKAILCKKLPFLLRNYYEKKSKNKAFFKRAYKYQEYSFKNSVINFEIH